jgi:hypothetical protein
MERKKERRDGGKEERRKKGRKGGMEGGRKTMKVRNLELASLDLNCSFSTDPLGDDGQIAFSASVSPSENRG